MRQTSTCCWLCCSSQRCLSSRVSRAISTALWITSRHFCRRVTWPSFLLSSMCSTCSGKFCCCSVCWLSGVCEWRSPELFCALVCTTVVHSHKDTHVTSSYPCAELLGTPNELIRSMDAWLIMLFFSMRLLRNYKKPEEETCRASAVWYFSYE